jgi:hypothetical protein
MASIHLDAQEADKITAVTARNSSKPLQDFKLDTRAEPRHRNRLSLTRITIKLSNRVDVYPSRSALHLVSHPKSPYLHPASRTRRENAGEPISLPTSIDFGAVCKHGPPNLVPRSKTRNVRGNATLVRGRLLRDVVLMWWLDIPSRLS